MPAIRGGSTALQAEFALPKFWQDLLRHYL